MALRWTGAAMLEAAKGRQRPSNYQPCGRLPWSIRPPTASIPTLYSRTAPRNLPNQQSLLNEFQQ